MQKISALKPACSIKFAVQFSDIDWAGVVNNAKYLTYIENTRIEHIFSLTGTRDFFGEMGVVVARTEIDYKYPARYNDKLRIDCRTSSVGNTSWVAEYEVYNENGNRLIASAKSVEVAFNFKSSKPIEIPSKIKEKLLQEVKSRAEKS